MRQPEFGVLELAFVSPALELQVHFVEHANSGAPDGMPEQLQPTVDLAGYFPIIIVKAV